MLTAWSRLRPKSTSRPPFGAAEPLTPIEDRGVGAIPSSDLRGIGLDLMIAILAPHDQPDLCSGGAAERHRRAGCGFHRPAHRAGGLGALAEPLPDTGRGSIDSSTPSRSAPPLCRPKYFTTATNTGSIGV